MTGNGIMEHASSCSGVAVSIEETREELERSLEQKHRELLGNSFEKVASLCASYRS